MVVHSEMVGRKKKVNLRHPKQASMYIRSSFHMLEDPWTPSLKLYSLLVLALRFHLSQPLAFIGSLHQRPLLPRSSFTVLSV